MLQDIRKKIRNDALDTANEFFIIGIILFGVFLFLWFSHKDISKMNPEDIKEGQSVKIRLLPKDAESIFQYRMNATTTYYEEYVISSDSEDGFLLPLQIFSEQTRHKLNNENGTSSILLYGTIESTGPILDEHFSEYLAEHNQDAQQGGNYVKQYVFVEKMRRPVVLLFLQIAGIFLLLISFVHRYKAYTDPGAKEFWRDIRKAGIDEEIIKQDMASSFDCGYPGILVGEQFTYIDLLDHRPRALPNDKIRLISVTEVKIDHETMDAISSLILALFGVITIRHKVENHDIRLELYIDVEGIGGIQTTYHGLSYLLDQVLEEIRKRNPEVNVTHTRVKRLIA
ncbi:MAG: hypothetical protein KBT01_08010 [Clostridiales bacterium]|nr:hypothetical protein [Candidatus Blautia equi]